MDIKDPKRNELKKYYGPGVWEDQAGALHFSLPDILKHLNVQDTPENQRQLMEEIKKQIQAVNPTAEMIYRKDWQD